MNYSEAKIEIESIKIISGEIVIIGEVEGFLQILCVDASMKDYDKYARAIDIVESVAKDELYELYIKTL